MKLKKILLSILFILIGGMILCINPESYVHRLVFFISVGCSVSVASYRGNSMSFRYLAKDKIYLVLFLLLLITGIFSLFSLYKDKDSLYTYLSLSLFAFSLIGLIIRNRKLKR